VIGETAASPISKEHMSLLTRLSRLLVLACLATMSAAAQNARYHLPAKLILSKGIPL